MLLIITTDQDPFIYNTYLNNRDRSVFIYTVVITEGFHRLCVLGQ